MGTQSILHVLDTETVFQDFFPLQHFSVLPDEVVLHAPDPDEIETLQILSSRKLLPAGWGGNLANYGMVCTGGAFISRYIFDHPEIVEGKNVMDVGAGPGAAAIVSKMVGAAKVTAVDHNPTAIEFIARNAKANSVEVHTLCRDALDVDYSDVDVVIAADLFVPVQATALQNTLLDQFHAGKCILAASGSAERPINLLMAEGTPLLPMHPKGNSKVKPPSYIVILGRNTRHATY